ncbi:TPA: EpsG family protein [Escherichia coli]
MLLIIFCFIYALLMSLLFDSDLFRDRLSYSGYYALDSQEILLSAYNQSIIKLIIEEPIFLIINIIIKSTNLIDRFSLPYIYVFIISFCFSYFTLKKSYNLLFFAICFCMLIFVSVSLHAQLVVLRQSIATCLLLFFVRKNHYNINKLIIVSIICALIHNSFFILTLFFITLRVLNKNSLKDRTILLSILISIFVSFSFYFLGKYFSFRQIDHMDSEFNVSGGGFILWLSCLLIIIIKNINSKKLSNIDTLSIFGLIFYIINYYFLPIGGRLLVTFIPFIFISLTSSINNRNKYFYFTLILYDIFFIIANIYKLNENLINNSLNNGFSLLSMVGF